MPGTTGPVSNALLKFCVAIKDKARLQPGYYSYSFNPAPFNFSQHAVNGQQQQVANPFVSLGDATTINDRCMSGSIANALYTLLLNRRKVHVHNAFVPSKNGVKTEINFSYSGEPSVTYWTRFLERLNTYFDLCNLWGPECDETRIQVTALALRGEALSWYQRNVSSAARQFDPWSWILMIILMEDHFLDDTVSERAEKTYSQLRQRDSSIAEFAGNLTKYAAFLPITPDDYSLRSRFIKGLNIDILRDLNWRGFRTSNYTFEQLVFQAKQAASNVIRMNEFEKDIAKHSQEPSSTYNYNGKYPPRQSYRNRSHSRTPSAGLPNSRPTSPHPRSNRSRSRTSRPQSRQRYRSKSPANKFISSKTRTTPDLHQQVTEDLSVAKVSNECWNCGQAGHFKDQCPNKDQRTKSPNRYHNNRNDRQASNSNVFRVSSSEKDYQSPPDETEGELDRDTELASPVMNSHSIIIEDDEDDDELLCYSRQTFIEPNTSCNAIETNDNSAHHRNTIHSSTFLSDITATTDRPERTPEQTLPVVIRIQVGKHSARVLIDTGAQLDMMSPTFADIIRKNADIRKLSEPVKIGMAVAGSHAYINYGAWTSVQLGPYFVAKHYFDIQKCPKYDIILGLPFLSKHNMTVSLGKTKYFTINDLKFPNKFGFPGVDSQIYKIPLPSKLPLRVSFKQPPSPADSRRQ